MFFKKLLYPRTLEGFISLLEEKTEALALAKPPSYHDELFHVFAEEYNNWMNFRVIPALKNNREVHMVNVTARLFTRNRGVLFFRLPVVVGSRLHKRTNFSHNFYCGELAGVEFTSEKTPLVRQFKNAIDARHLFNGKDFYIYAEPSLLRRKGVKQRTIHPARVWGDSLPWQPLYSSVKRLY